MLIQVLPRSTLVLKLLNFQKGQKSQQLLLSLTTVECLLKNDLVPVFIDVEPLSYCIDAERIEENINGNTVAILAPNLMGNLQTGRESEK